MKRHDPDTGEFKEVSFTGALLLGLTNEQVKGAIIVGWRVTTALGLLGAYGLLGPIPGLSGFAYADETKATRIDALDSELFELRIKQCQALDQGVSALVYTVRLNEKWRTYVQLVGHEPKVPDCKELK
jgi:hypothetical protein